jgi:hypothetical protein
MRWTFRQNRRYNTFMRTVLCAAVLFFLSVSAFADTYTGIVSGVKHFSQGGIAVNLDGKYPDQKMTLYVSPKDEAVVGALPSEGAKITATGTITQYRGKPEIKIHEPGQWKW